MEYFTTGQLAERWGISRRTIYNMTNDGRLSCVRLSKWLRIPVSEVERIEKEQLENNPSTEAIRSNENQAYLPQAPKHLSRNELLTPNPPSEEANPPHD